MSGYVSDRLRRWRLAELKEGGAPAHPFVIGDWDPAAIDGYVLLQAVVIDGDDEDRIYSGGPVDERAADIAKTYAEGARRTG
jgi:hypothetical protein